MIVNHDFRPLLVTVRVRDGGLLTYCFVFGTHPHTPSINKRAIDFIRDIHTMHTSPKHDLDLIIIIIYPWKLAEAKKRKKE